MAIDKTKLTGVEKVYPLKVSPYEQYMGDFENPSVVSKINSMIQTLLQMGRLTNQTVTQWNNVMEWIVNGGMDEIATDITTEKVEVALNEVMRMLDVSLNNGLKDLATDVTDKKISELLANGQFESMISESLVEINDVVEGKLEGFNLQLTETELELKRKRELEDLSPTVLSAIEGGGNTSFNLLSIPQDGSVTHTKTDFVVAEESINLLDLTQINDTGYLNNNNFTLDSVYFTSGFIVAKTGDTVRYRKDSSLGSNTSLNCYDSNLNFLGTSPSGVLIESLYYESLLVIPNTRFVKKSYSDGSKTSAMVVVNQPYPTTFIPYQKKLYLTNNFSFSKKQKDDLYSEIPSVEGFELNPLKNKVATFNGDSIMAGAGFLGGFAKIIAERNNMAYENKAIGGGTITAETKNPEGVLKHWISRTVETMNENADYAIFEGGVNDASTNVTMGVISEGYESLLDDTTFCGAVESLCKKALARFHGKKIGFVFVHRMTSAQQRYNANLYLILEKWGISYIDLYKEIPPMNYIEHLKQNYTHNADGWHPNEMGYRKYYVDKIESWMKSL